MTSAQGADGMKKARVTTTRASRSKQVRRSAAPARAAPSRA